MKEQDQVIADPREVLVWLWPLVVHHCTYPRNNTATAWSIDVWMVFCIQHVEANLSSPAGVRPNEEVICLFFSHHSFSSIVQANEKDQ